jgi:hypothetical protein
MEQQPYLALSSKKPRVGELPALCDRPGHCDLGISRGAGDTRPRYRLTGTYFRSKRVGDLDGSYLDGGGGGGGDDSDGGKEDLSGAR